MSEPVKVWVEEKSHITLYLVPPTVLKRLLKMIAEYEVKHKKAAKK